MLYHWGRAARWLNPGRSTIPHQHHLPPSHCMPEYTTMTTHQSLAQLSLAARLAIALHCFEQYCQAHRLSSPAIVEFLDYLWQFPTIHGPEAFRSWERKQPLLVDIGLGGYFPEGYSEWLQDAGIEPAEFRALLEHTVEIVYGSFYGASDDSGSLTHLQHVLDLTKQAGITPPPLSHFAHSRFADRHGLGNTLSVAERDRWRNLLRANDDEITGDTW
jgi:hypothetical protein